MITEACERITWSGREALHLSAAGYEAIVVPSLGANAIVLQTEASGHRIDILRTPPDDLTLLNDPFAYGIPILFPANRVAGGEYSWDGVTYRFPRNYPNDVHIHGVLHNRAWPVDDFGTADGVAWACFSLDTETDVALQNHFPVPMRIRLKISLSERGLTHRFTVENKSEDKEIPIGLAYHTAFNVDFCGKSDGVRLHVPLLARCTDDPTDRLPNGQTTVLDSFEARLASPEGAPPLDAVVDYLYTARPGEPEAVLRDSRSGCEVVYRVGPENHYWILWNQTATEGFIAIEPQTWLSNAMHCASPVAQGAVLVPSGQAWSSECSVFVRAMREG